MAACPHSVLELSALLHGGNLLFCRLQTPPKFKGTGAVSEWVSTVPTAMQARVHAHLFVKALDAAGVCIVCAGHPLLVWNKTRLHTQLQQLPEGLKGKLGEHCRHGCQQGPQLAALALGAAGCSSCRHQQPTRSGVELQGRLLPLLLCWLLLIGLLVVLPFLLLHPVPVEGEGVCQVLPQRLWGCGLRRQA